MNWKAHKDKSIIFPFEIYKIKLINDDIVYDIYFNAVLSKDYGSFNKRDFFSQPFKYEKGNGVKYIGVPIIITNDNGPFELAVQGVPDSTLTYDVTSPQPCWFVTFEPFTEAEFIFTEPCLNDFNPQVTPN